jgi:hypothetical protein
MEKLVEGNIGRSGVMGLGKWEKVRGLWVKFVGGE